MDLNTFFHYFFNVDGTGYVPHAYWIVDPIRIVVRVILGMIVGILLPVPLLVWYERRLLGWMQQRQGPNRVGPFGLLQTIADGVKLLMKEDLNPANVDKFLFVIAPVVFLVPSLVLPGVIPWGPSRVWGSVAPGVNIGVLYLLAWSSLAVYGIVLAGWASNNKYSLLGGLRSSAQMISYELGMGLAIITIVLMTGSLNLRDIVENQGYYQIAPALTQIGIALPKWNLLMLFPMGFLAFVIYTIAMLAETNRAPFDLPEAETELVAGYHTEYTSMKFATFFMGEYANMIIVSAINATLFWGGYHGVIPLLDGAWLSTHVHGFAGSVLGALVPPATLLAKIIAGLYFFIWVRATLPRLRYDMLMRFGWQGLLPIALGNVLLVAFAIALGWLPAAAAWVAIFAIVLAAVVPTRSVQKFVVNTRRNTTVTLHSTVVPFHATPEQIGTGGRATPSAPGADAASVDDPDAAAAAKG